MSGARVLLGVLLLGSACQRVDVVLLAGRDGGPSLDGGPPALPGLQSLRIEPGTISVIDPGVAPYGRATFTVFGRFEGEAEEQDVTTQVSLALSDPSLGTIGEGSLITAGVAGDTELSARAGALDARAAVSVRLEVVAAAPPLSPADPALFPADTSADVLGGTAPEIIYPATGAELPLDLRGTTIQWTASGLDLFELRVDSNLARVRWYTNDLVFLQSDDAWRWMNVTHAGREARITVRGLSRANPGVIFRSAPIDLAFSRSRLPGAAYYWSSGERGIMRGTAGTPVATKIYPAPGTTGGCGGCHALSRDGRRLAIGGDDESLSLYDLSSASAQRQREVDYGWGSFAPDGRRLVYAREGSLSILDAETGARLGGITLPAGQFATHPDWSPDGAWIAVALGDEKPHDDDLEHGTSLVKLRANADGTFGAPEVILASTTEEDNNYFPSWSPDSRWIAFVRSRGHTRDNRGATLHLIRSDGSEPPIALTRANRIVGPQLDRTDTASNMPTWAPSSDGSTEWLVFSSTREYGAILPAGGPDQLWISSLKLDRAAGGADPSAPAIWLPFQASSTGNHRAYWSVSEELQGCTPNVELCDGRDNDCDTEIDEQCCTPEAERCGDQLDQDCDGVADERCDCAAAEICANGRDDDCNGLEDGDDPACDP